MMVRLESARVLTKEAKSLRAQLKKQLGIKESLSDLQNLLAQGLGFRHFQHYQAEAKNTAIASVQSTHFHTLRQLQIKIIQLIKQHYPALAYQGLFCLHAKIDPDADWLANLPALSPEQFVSLSPPVGVEEVDRPLRVDGRLDEDLTALAFARQLGEPLHGSWKACHRQAERQLSELVPETQRLALYQQHGYIRTYLMGLYEAARAISRSSVTPHDLLFLKNRDRTLWYGLTCLSRSAVFVEGSGLLHHYVLETQRGVTPPDMAAQVQVLKHALNQPVYHEPESKQQPIPEPQELTFFEHIDYDKLAKKAGTLRTVLGTDKKGKPVTTWDISRGVFIQGCTGSGRVRCNFSFLYDRFKDGSGGLILDARGDNSVYWLTYSMLRALGRDDDLIVINGMDETPEQSMQTFRWNFFHNASAEDVVHILTENSLHDVPPELKEKVTQFIALAIPVVYAHYPINDAQDLLHRLRLSDLMTIITTQSDMASLKLRTWLEGCYGPLQKGEAWLGMDWLPGNILQQHSYLLMAIEEASRCLSIQPEGTTPIMELNFDEAVANNQIIMVLCPGLSKDINVNQAFQKGMCTQYFRALDNYHQAHEEQFIRNGQQSDYKDTWRRRLNPIVLLNECLYINPGWLRENIAEQRLKTGLLTIVSQWNVDDWCHVQQDEEGIERLIHEMGNKLFMHTEGSEVVERWIHKWDMEPSPRLLLRDLMSLLPGEAYLISQGKIQYLRLRYIDVTTANCSQLNRYLRAPE